MNSSVFPDINVWLAMSFRGHSHHPPAKSWFDALNKDEELIFSRVTQLGFLRLLTNSTVMGNRVKTQREAWLLYDEFLVSGSTRFTREPPSIEKDFRRFANLDSASPNDWTDSYLTAFAEAADLRLVTFDKALAAKTRRAILLNPNPTHSA